MLLYSLRRQIIYFILLKATAKFGIRIKMLLSSSGYSNEINIFGGGISGVKNVPMVKKTFYTIEDIHLLEPFFFENFNDFIFSSEQSGDEKEFVVACEDKFTFLVEASPEPKMNFSKRSAEKLDLNPFK